MNRLEPILVLALTLALVLSTLAGCGDAETSLTTLTTIKSTLPSLRINATRIAALYKQAKAAGAPAFQGSITAEEIVTALESGVNGSGLYSDSVFRISPIKTADRPKVVVLLEENLGL